MATTTTIDVAIRRAGQQDRAAVAATVSAAFFDDPVVEWLLPDRARRQELSQPLFELYADAYLPHGETYLAADGAGAGVWLPPHHRLLAPEDEEVFGATVAEIAGADAGRLFQLEEIFAVYHPQVPHYYPQFLAVVPWAQGRGIGSALLRDGLRKADAEGMPAYLESTSPRNRALYERHGFVCQGEFTLPDGGPTLSRMWRDPQ